MSEDPTGHRRYIRTTNLLERSVQEEKRRIKVIPHPVNERGAMKLVSGVRIRTSKRWNKVKMNDLKLTQLKNIRAMIWPDADKTSRISRPKAA